MCLAEATARLLAEIWRRSCAGCLALISCHYLHFERQHFHRTCPYMQNPAIPVPVPARQVRVYICMPKERGWGHAFRSSTAASLGTLAAHMAEAASGVRRMLQPADPWIIVGIGPLGDDGCVANTVMGVWPPPGAAYSSSKWVGRGG